MKKGRFLILLLTFFVSMTAFAQKQQYSGVVVDGGGEPVIGASVIQKGTTSGAITDLDGKFTVSVEPGSTLVISYIGYKNYETKVSNNMRIVLEEDSKTLSDVVVIGYGVQKKSVVTASIAKVNTEDLASTAPVRMDNALKGLAAGVQVTSSSGQPGAAARIRIRGNGTINSDKDGPLYIVDGMPIEGGLDYLSPSDIESLEVLKDAASAAIYGARAANGVVLVTTKKGKIGKVRVNYNFSTGWQTAWKHRDVLDATSYAVLTNEAYVNAGQAAPYSDPYSYGKGTDWQDLVFNDNAPVTNHEVNVSGATEKVNYYLSMGYYKQEGIIGGNYDRSNYDRMTLRSNTKYNIFDDSKERNWLNKLDITVNASYARIHSKAIEANAWQGSVLGSAIALPPILTPYKNGQDALDEIKRNSASSNYVPMYTGRVDENGVKEIFTTPGAAYHEFSNPLAKLSLPGTLNWSHKIVANFMADLQIWDNLVYHINYGVDQSFWGYDGYTPIYYLREGESSDKTSAFSNSCRGTVWQIENTLSYDKEIGKHAFNVVLGQSAKKSYGNYLGGSRDDLISLDHPFIDGATGEAKEGKQSVYGGPNYVTTLASLFGRLSYNYDERYMAQFTIRRDGSSKFGSNNHYAVFPSFSLGWNVMNEAFMQNTKDWLSNFKIRFSWGKNGNENIGNGLYAVQAATGGNNNYLLGRDETSAIGSKVTWLPNADLKWEESVQTDLGVDFGFFNNALTFTVDYFVKKTNGMLLRMPIPSYIGENSPWGNVGEMKNSGVEFEASYKWNIADAKFRVSGNISYLKNELINYGNDTGYQNLDSFQGIGTITRAENGQPFPFFYGYKTDGVFQNQAEIDEYMARQHDDFKHTVQKNPTPGDVRFKDVDGDGVITENDQTRIGKGTPDWSFGLNLTANWRGFDFSMMLQGTIGNDIFDATRRTDVELQNMPSWMLGRWTGEGTSNKYPKLVYADKSDNWKSSDLYLTDGSYMRIKNMQLGYTLPQNITRKFFVDKLRFFVAVENLVTLTKYAGLDPEISSTTTSLGVDYGVYPQPRTWTIGVNVGF
ncbi:MAG: TonB-dependent receptor [Prevotella sp.]|nr:TonB-dependent receptor [Prevotella sp.]